MTKKYVFGWQILFSYGSWATHLYSMLLYWVLQAAVTQWHISVQPLSFNVEMAKTSPSTRDFLAPLWSRGAIALYMVCHWLKHCYPAHHRRCNTLSKPQRNELKERMSRPVIIKLLKTKDKEESSKVVRNDILLTEEETFKRHQIAHQQALKPESDISFFKCWNKLSTRRCVSAEITLQQRRENETSSDAGKIKKICFQQI